MPQDLISKKTRYEFREFLTGWTLREIEMEFDAADVTIDSDYSPSVSGQRRTLIEKYYHSVDWTKWADIRKVLTVFENILASLEGQINSQNFMQTNEWAEKKFLMLKKWLEKDGFSYEQGKLTAKETDKIVQDIVDDTAKLDAPELQRQIERLGKAVEDDPSLAIGTAKELIETTCKIILENRGVSFREEEDIPKLVKETRKALGLVPDNIPNSAKGAEVIRRLLGNLGGIAQGLSELRNLYGTGHGKSGKSKGLAPRHARLAAGAASTLTRFLLDTHRERNI